MLEQKIERSSEIKLAQMSNRRPGTIWSGGVFNLKFLKKDATTKDDHLSVGPVDLESLPITETDGECIPDVKISVIIPVYNTMPYLTELLNSLESQSLSSSQFEVIAIDDGSTDFSGEILDVYAKRNPNFRIIHQENSGWPGKPRNVGIDEANGEWVFFCDGDDVLGEEALKKMLSFAQENDVDILIPKMVGLNGRRIMSSLYRTTSVDTPLETVLRSLNPIKLMRRSLLVDNKIRFSEERVRLEDGMAVVQAYMHARRVSILSDYDYYHARTRSDGQNISISYIEPHGYVASLTHIAQTIESNVRDDKRSRELIAGIFSRKALHFYSGKRFLSYSEIARMEWMDEHSIFLNRFLAGQTAELFSGIQAERVAAILSKDYEHLVKLAHIDLRESRKPELMNLGTTEDGVQISIRSFATKLAPARLIIEDRDEKRAVTVELQANADGSLLTAEISSSKLAADLKRLGNVCVVYGNTDTRRIIMDETIGNVMLKNVRYYRTANGYFSVDVRKARI
ncbi:glycosyltransferase family 2 protein [Glutamicibacter arilaitensis]|uniref:glycosyltransferase family 2 protein n=1 Tax=Glutamicibacter arilaitensis TaxID=256701 RepID=UPI003A9464BC